MTNSKQKGSLIAWFNKKNDMERQVTDYTHLHGEKKFANRGKHALEDSILM